MYICELCGEEFQGNGRQKKRCSKDHERSCTHCGKLFTMRSTMNANREHCSKECQLLSQKKTKPCPICGTEFWKASATCSRSCANELRRRTDATFIGECAACGKSTTGRVKYCDRDHYRICEVCKKDFIVDPRTKKRTCSSLCNGQLVNSPESMEKRKATSRERYGTDFPQQAEEVKAKMEATHRERYGVKSPLASAELRAKGFKTSKERYGHEWYAASEEGKAARAKTNMERYGAENPFRF